MERRNFIRICAGSMGAGLTASHAGPATAQQFPRARLTLGDGAPVKAAALAALRNYVFFYPFRATPCFLLNLGRLAKPRAIKTAGIPEYEWPGGAGAARSVVSYSAICSHQLTYPTRDISFISFRAGKSPVNRFGDVIHCCSDHSQYDPAEGARVLAGPAPRPLAAILLEHDPQTDGLTAIGTLGPDVFNEFFRKYELKLALESGGRTRQTTGGTCVVTELDNYCRQQVKC